MDTTTNTVATAMVTTPFWLPWLHTSSEVAATVTPILGAIWLLVQISSKLHNALRKDKNEDRH